MSYEYKEEILLDIGPEPNCNYESESENYYSKIRELEKVYAMAERVSKYLKDLDFLERNLNECLTKVEAFDRIKAYSDKAINGDIHSLVLAEGIIDVVEQYDINRLSESGEYDVKK